MKKINLIIKSVILIFLPILILLTPKQKTTINNTVVYEKITPFKLNSNSITYNQINSSPNLSTNSADDNIISPSRQEVINKAEDMTEVKWTPTKNLTDKNALYIFLKGKTYCGIPYSMGSYQTTSSNDFLSKLNITNSLIGNDCSGFVSAAWGIKRQTTLSLFNAAKKGTLIDGKSVKEIPWDTIKAGDAIMHDNGKGKGHIVLYLSTDNKNSDLLTVYEQNVSTLVPFHPIPTARKDIRSKNALIKEGYFPIRLMILN